MNNINRKKISTDSLVDSLKEVFYEYGIAYTLFQDNKSLETLGSHIIKSKFTIDNLFNLHINDEYLIIEAIFLDNKFMTVKNHNLEKFINAIKKFFYKDLLEFFETINNYPTPNVNLVITINNIRKIKELVDDYDASISDKKTYLCTSGLKAKL